MDRDPEDVRAAYDRIAAHFAETRQYPWPEVTDFLEGREGGVGLDLGCGNGRHLDALAERVDRAVGLDISPDLLAIARDRASERDYVAAHVRGDAATVPIRDDRVDLAVYVATLHHLAPRSRRRESLAELARVLAPGGRAVVSAWSVEHDRFDATEGFDAEIDWTLPGGETVPRYYHVYDLGEFREDLRASPLEPVETFVSSGNCYAVVGPG